MVTIVTSRPAGTNFNKNTETNFYSTLLDDGKPISSNTVNTLISLETHNKSNNLDNNNHNHTDGKTTNNTNSYEDHKHRQPLNSTELTQNSRPIKQNTSTVINCKHNFCHAYNDNIQYT